VVGDFGGTHNFNLWGSLRVFQNFRGMWYTIGEAQQFSD
jgi:hypothetical protein